MEINQVFQEIMLNGGYRRGDSSVEILNGDVVMDLRLKDSSLIKDLIPSLPVEIESKIRYPTIEEIIELTDLPIEAEDDRIRAIGSGKCIWEMIKPLIDFANKIKYPDVHIIRKAGAFALISDLNVEYVTKSCLEYCPLQERCFEKDNATLKEKLIKEIEEHVVGHHGMFTADRPLRECEANIPFGASEMIMDAWRKDYFDSAVLVCEGLGTVVSLSPESTQGIGAHMTGTFYTSPVKGLVDKCYSEEIYPVFPETAEIEQISGVKAAMELGKRRIAVTTAAGYNRNLDKITEMEGNGVALYKFALCSTGVDRETAETMANHADLVWSCASKHTRDIVAPRALVQIGTKIPVYVMTERGWDVVKNRLYSIDPNVNLDGLLEEGERYVILGGRDNKLNIVPVSEIDEKLIDSPRPLV